MSTGQSSSRVGDSASNPAESSPEIVQTVKKSDETHISSFITRANRQVEAAIAFLVEDNHGSVTPEESLRELSERIQNIISLTFSGSADITPKTSLPLFVQVPEWIVEQLTSDEDGEDNLKYAAEAMRDYAKGKPEAEKWQPLNDGVFESFKWIVDATVEAIAARKTGETLTAPELQSTSFLSHVPRFIYDFTIDDEHTIALHELVKDMRDAVLKRDLVGDDIEIYITFSQALHELIDQARTFRAFGVTQPTGELKAAILTPEDDTLDYRRFEFCDPDKYNAISIVSDSGFFTALADAGALATYQSCIAAWFSAWSLLSQDQKDNFETDQYSATVNFGELMHFLSRMTSAVAQKRYTTGFNEGKSKSEDSSDTMLDLIETYRINSGLNKQIINSLSNQVDILTQTVEMQKGGLSK